MLTALIVAAGSSQRMGFDKLFADLAGRPVVAWSIAAFEACAAVDAVTLVARPEKVSLFRELAQREQWAKLRTILPGGAQRHFSVWNGLQTLSEGPGDFVAVHDGARPLVTPDMIERCLGLAQQTGAACCAARGQRHAQARGRRRGASSAGWTARTSGRCKRRRPSPWRALVAAYRQIIDAGLTVTDETSALEHDRAAGCPCSTAATSTSRSRILKTWNSRGTY